MKTGGTQTAKKVFKESEYVFSYILDGRITKVLEKLKSKGALLDFNGLLSYMLESFNENVLKDYLSER